MTTAKTAKYNRLVLCKLGFEQTEPTPIYKDDKPAIDIIASQKPTEQTRPIDICFFTIQDWIHKSKDVLLSHIPTIINPSNNLTKPLGRVLHERHARYIMGHYNTVLVCFVTIPFWEAPSQNICFFLKYNWIPVFKFKAQRPGTCHWTLHMLCIQYTSRPACMFLCFSFWSVELTPSAFTRVSVDLIIWTNLNQLDFILIYKNLFATMADRPSNKKLKYTIPSMKVCPHFKINLPDKFKKISQINDNCECKSRTK